MSDITKEYLDEKLGNVATKDDLERFATKDDLERFATKDDLERFATKDDIAEIRQEMKSFATKDDLRTGLEELAQIVAEGFRSTATKEELKALTARVERVEKEMSEIRFEISQLAQQVKEFVATTHRHEAEFAQLTVKYKELEARVVYLESHLGAAA